MVLTTLRITSSVLIWGFILLTANNYSTDCRMTTSGYQKCVPEKRLSSHIGLKITQCIFMFILWEYLLCLPNQLQGRRFLSINHCRSICKDKLLTVSWGCNVNPMQSELNQISIWLTRIVFIFSCNFKFSRGKTTLRTFAKVNWSIQDKLSWDDLFCKRALLTLTY